MADIVTFDGITRIITEIANGTENELDLVEIYSEWKEWVKTSDNAKYAQAFRFVGGDPLTGTQNLGTTFFLVNGWRIRPAELEHRLTIVGNLFTDPEGLDRTAPTLGTFRTEVIFNVSNLVDSSVARLDLAQLLQAVYLDPANGVAGTAEGVGTPTLPSNNIADARTIADAENLASIALRGSITLDQDFEDFSFIGVSSEFNDSIDFAGYSVDGSVFEGMQLTGIMSGEIECAQCGLDLVEGVAGVFRDCGLRSSFIGADNATLTLINSISEVAGTSTPILTLGANTTLNVRNHSGGLELRNVTAGTTGSVDLDPGHLKLHSSCTGGLILVRGTGRFTDNSTGTVVTDAGLLTTETIARGVLEAPISQIPIADSVEETLSVLFGLVGQARCVRDDFVYDANGLLTSVRLRVFATADAAAAATQGGTGEGEIFTTVLAGTAAPAPNERQPQLIRAGQTGAAIPAGFTLGERRVIWEGFDSQEQNGVTWFNYTAYPGLTTNDAGELIAYYYRGGTHSNEISRGTTVRSLDGTGRGWQDKLAEVQVHSSATDQDATGGITRLDSGTLMTLHFLADLDDGTTPTSLPYTTRSTDGGDSYDTPVQLVSQGTEWTRSGASVLELTPGGRIVAPVYYHDVGETRRTAGLQKTDNGGTSWEVLAVIAQDPENASARPWEEPVIGRLQDGRIMCLLREDANKQIWQVFSSDEGLTWTTPVFAFSGWARPTWVQMASGQLVAFTRDSTSNRGVYYYSRDNTATWELGGEFQDATEDKNVYAAPVDLGGGVLAVVHGQDLAGFVDSRTRFECLRMYEAGVATPSIYTVTQMADFDGSSEIDMGDISFFDGATSFAVSFWWRTPGALTTGALFSKNSLGNRQIDVRLGATRRLEIFLSGDGTTPILSTTPVDSIAGNSLWHTVISFEAGTLRCWLNGVEQVLTLGANPASIYNGGSAPFQLGASNSTTRVTAQMSSFALFGASVSDVEVQELHNAGVAWNLATFSGGAPSHWWPLDGDALDVSGSSPGTWAGTEAYVSTNLPSPRFP